MKSVRRRQNDKIYNKKTLQNNILCVYKGYNKYNNNDVISSMNLSRLVVKNQNHYWKRTKNIEQIERVKKY